VTGDPAVVLDDVHRRFGGVIAVAGVSLEVPVGEIVGLIGPNGSGKSTVMNLLSGQLEVDEGRIHMFGRDVTRMRPERRAQLGMSRMFQQPRLVLALSPLDNIALGTWAGRRGWRRSLSLRGWRHARTTARRVAETFDIADLLDGTTENLSHVERRMIEMARIVAADARLLLLDEPMAGLDRGEKERVVERVRALRSPDRAVVIVEHDVAVIAGLCDRVYCLARGQLIAAGTPAEVIEDPQVRELYLGRSRTSHTPHESEAEAK
jgi:ABC-type branched-subunit amino acid transport system ATPase component